MTRHDHTQYPGVTLRYHLTDTGRCCGSDSVGPETLELSALSELFEQVGYHIGGLADD